MEYVGTSMELIVVRGHKHQITKYSYKYCVHPSGVVLLLVAAMIKVKIDFVNTSIPFCQGRLTNASRPERVT
jgi:hypothetical protein